LLDWQKLVQHLRYSVIEAGCHLITSRHLLQMIPMIQFYSG